MALTSGFATSACEDLLQKELPSFLRSLSPFQLHSFRKGLCLPFSREISRNFPTAPSSDSTETIFSSGLWRQLSLTMIHSFSLARLQFLLWTTMLLIPELARSFRMQFPLQVSQQLLSSSQRNV